MADDFGSAQTADLAANGKRQSAGQAIEEAAGVEVARPGSVDNACNRCCRDAMRRSVCQNHAACRTSGQGGDRDMPADRSHSSVKIIRLVKRADFGLVGEKNVDMSVDKVAERRAMPPDAKR